MVGASAGGVGTDMTVDARWLAVMVLVEVTVIMTGALPASKVEELGGMVEVTGDGATVVGVGVMVGNMFGTLVTVVKTSPTSYPVSVSGDFQPFGALGLGGLGMV